MSVASNRDHVRRFIEDVWNGGRTDAIGDYVARDYVAHDPADPEPLRGQAALTASVVAYRRAYPDLVNTIEAQLGEDELVATRWSSLGTHLGPSMGLTPTGRRRRVTGIVISSFSDGLIAEEWHSWDLFGLLRQLGAVPPSFSNTSPAVDRPVDPYDAGPRP